MPYDFVANLKPGHWTPLDNLWLKSVKKILKKAKTNSIKQIRLVRLPKKHFIRNQTMSLKNSNEDVIYEAVQTQRIHHFLSLLIKFMTWLEKKIGYMVKVTASLIWLPVKCGE
jgi:hypothetical protein